MFHTILIGSDGSENAANAARLAAEIAKRFDSQVVALNVFDVSFAAAGDVGAWSLAVSPSLISECMQGERAAAEKSIQPSLTELQLPYRMLQETGHPVNTIVSTAKREHADLIVLGNRGLSRVEELLLGSVSHGVLHHASCPVLIQRGAPHPLRRILLASDNSAGAWKATEAACALARKFEACLTVLKVQEPIRLFHHAAPKPHPAEAPEPAQESERLREEIQPSVEGLAAEHEITFQMREEQGHAGETIVGFARDCSYDLIVMGSRGLGGFERLLLGSVSHYVTHHADCSVLVVR